MTDLEDLYSPFKGLSGHQGTQTLDQTYYDMLHIDELQKRDKDQVVYKWFKEWQRRQDSEKAAAKTLDKERKHGRKLSNIWTEGTFILTTHSTATLNIATLAARTTAASGKTRTFDGTIFPKGMEQEDGHPQHNPGEEREDKDNPLGDDPPGDDRNKSSHSDIRARQSEAKLLMIHQLWLWKLDERMCIFLNSIQEALRQLTKTKILLSRHFRKDGMSDTKTVSWTPYARAESDHSSLRKSSSSTSSSNVPRF